MIEELGEFAKIIRKQEGKKNRKKLKIDLEKAFLKSKKKIEQRHQDGY